MKKEIFILLIALALFSCKSNKIDSLAEAAVPYLTFQSGGGFTGKYTTYSLLENGQIFSQGMDLADAKAVGSIDKDVAAQIFSNYDFLNMKDVKMEEYGNYTYTITMTNGTKSHKILWEKDMKGSEVYQMFFKNAMNSISKVVHPKD